MEVKAFWNHELDPGMRALVGSLSGNQAVGCWLAIQDSEYFLMPIGVPEILKDLEGEAHSVFREHFINRARLHFAQSNPHKEDQHDHAD